MTSPSLGFPREGEVALANSLSLGNTSSLSAKPCKFPLLNLQGFSETTVRPTHSNQFATYH